MNESKYSVYKNMIELTEEINGIYDQYFGIPDLPDLRPLDNFLDISDGR